MKSWIDEYIEGIKVNKEIDIIIYGAGKAAQLLIELLKNKNISISGVCVSNKYENNDEILGYRVVQFDEANFTPRKTEILIGFIERKEKTIEFELTSQNFYKVVPLPRQILELDSWERERISKPIIEVTPSIGCRVHCKYCPQDILVKRYFKNDKNRKSVMTLDDYKRYLDMLPIDTIIDFSGFVEPFLNADSVEMMIYTAEQKHKMTLYTTFRGLSYEDFQVVKNLPFNYVCIHTPDADGYAAIPMTEEYFTIFKEALVSKKADGTSFIDTANCQSRPHPKIVDITNGKLKIYCELQDRAGNLDTNSNVLSHAKNKGKMICSRAPRLNHNVLLPDGTIVLCCNDFGMRHVLGNLNESTYDEIISGISARNIKEAMNKGNVSGNICEKCIFATEA